MNKEKIGIIGCGWLGYRLAQYLGDHFEIHTTVTSPDKMDMLLTGGFHLELVNFETNEHAEWQPWKKLTVLDHIIITVPLFSKRIDNDRLQARIRNLSRFISSFQGNLILMSSIGVYQGFTGTVTEAMLPPLEVAGEKEMKALFSQLNILRLGGLMGDDRLLGKYKVTEIDNCVNHIHFMDICRIVQILITRKVQSSVYNVTAPSHPSKRAVINEQLSVRDAYLPAPGGKMVVSQKLIDEFGYQFLYPDPRYFHLV